MPNQDIPETAATSEPNESFDKILSQFERSHVVRQAEGTREGTVVSF
jgi:hypothetical protein